MSQNSQRAVPNSSGSAPPRLKAPANAADCHIHTYDPRFAPPVPKVRNATAQDYRLLQQRLGFARVVIVQPRNYATDNSATLDAIARLGIANARGVAVLRPEVSDAELKKLDAGGIRGIRFTTGNPQTAIVSVDMIEPLAKRIAGMGWHVQLNMPAEQIVEHADLLRRLPAQIVFDHMGQVLPEGLAHPAYSVIRGLIDQGRAWVKISIGNLKTSIGPPTYTDVAPIAQAYVKAAPQRCVWGTDWPHPSAGDNPPDDAAVFDLLSGWAPEEATRHRILVTNPQALYGFAP